MSRASRLGRRAIVAVLVTGVIGASAHGQQQSDAKDDESLNKIREAISRPALVITGGPSLFEPDTTRDQWHVGVLTFLPPDTAGEFLRVQVPIGALVMKPVRAIRKAQHDRAERSAHEEVLRALADFQNARDK
jgi:hypothetical protein